MAGGTGEFTMVPVGEPGPTFRPEHDYFSVALVAIRMPSGGWQKFAPVVWSSVMHYAFDGEGGKKQLFGLFPGPQGDRPEFSRNDRVTIMDVQLIPRIVAREELHVDFTLASVKEKDFLAGVLKAATDIVASPAASFVSQIIPGGAVAVETAKGATAAAESVNNSINELLGTDKVQSLGRYIRRLSAPMPSGLFAFVDKGVDASKLKFDPATNILRDANGPLKKSYAVVRLQRETTRPDWMTLPDLTQAWNRIREAKLGGGDVLAAIDHFRLTAQTSPDLTPGDAEKLTRAAQQKFAPELSGAESVEMGDPGSMRDALEHFMDDTMESRGEESAFFTNAVSANAPWSTPGPFTRSLEMLLRHEGGYVDHPDDKGGPTNKGVTKSVYDSFRRSKGLPMRSVKELTADELHEIYYIGYWLQARCPEMPTEAMAALMFDAAVNHSPKRAIKLLQQGAGMADAKCDGVWGIKTRSAVVAAAANALALVDSCLLRRERFYLEIVKNNPKQGAFLNGWMNRVAGLRVYLRPLLAKAPNQTDTESALFMETGERVYLRAADTEFPQTAAATDNKELPHLAKAAE